MSKHDDRLSLSDMLCYAQEAVDLLGDESREGLGRDRVLQLALTRLIEIVGEAANRISQHTQEKNAEVLWPQIIGMRNRLIHGYDVIDLGLLWDTVTEDFPSLISKLRQIVEGD